MGEAPERERGSREREPDVFSVLDGIDFKALQEWKEIPGFTELANELVHDALSSEYAKELRAIVESSEEETSPTPKTFDDMLDPTVGTMLQRVIKWYIRVGDADKTIIFSKLIGVDKVPKLVKLFRSVVARKHTERKKQIVAAGGTDNYFIGNREFATLLDFAVDKTTFNEIVHLFGVIIFTMLLVVRGSLFAHGNEKMLVGIMFDSGALLSQIYLVLAQRYTRARVSKTIDRMLQSKAAKAGFDLSKFRNEFDLLLPKQRPQ